MILEMKVPSPGESISEVQISEWLKRDGDYVFKNEEIAIVETDKATLSILAEESGTLTILANENDTVTVGSVICRIDTDAKNIANKEESSINVLSIETKKSPSLTSTKTIVDKKTTSRIELKGMKFYAHHGLYKEEKEKGGWFMVDISFECNAQEAIEKDSINGTINYEIIYSIVKQEMEVPSNLIEHVVGRIHHRIKKEVTGVLKLITTLYKMEPPLGGTLDHVSITLSEV